MLETVSTLRNVSNVQPEFPLGEICGKFKISPSENKLAEGGLRCQGLYKRDLPDKPLVTYLTVVRNNAKTLEQCMKSVWDQTYDNVEYIVVDGASTDGTVDLIQTNSHLLDYYVSAPDNGIYNAMNKALALASGKIINILNSDDWAEPNSAREVADIFQKTHFQFLAGSGVVYNPDGTRAYQWNPREINLGMVFFGMPVMHQSVYATRDCYNSTGGYDESYKITGDFHWITKVVTSRMKIERTNLILSHFALGGASANKETDFIERVRVVKEYFPTLTQEEIVELFNELDVTIFWNQLNAPKSFDNLYAMVEKYNDSRLLLKTITEAILLRYAELTKVYLAGKVK